MSFDLLVDGVFEIKGRGIVLAGHLPLDPIFVKTGVEVQIENPDGTVVYGTISGIEHISRRTERTKTPYGLLIRGITKTSVQPGARIKPRMAG